MRRPRRCARGPARWPSTRREARSNAMKSVLSVVLVLALVPLAACAPKVNDPADIQAVKQTVEAFAKAMNAGDADGRGRDDDRQDHLRRQPLPGGRRQGRGPGDERRPDRPVQRPSSRRRSTRSASSATWRSRRGTWTIKLTPKAEGLAPIADSGSWMVAGHPPGGRIVEMGLARAQQQPAHAGHDGRRRRGAGDRADRARLGRGDGEARPGGPRAHPREGMDARRRRPGDDAGRRRWRRSRRAPTRSSRPRCATCASTSSATPPSRR